MKTILRLTALTLMLLLACPCALAATTPTPAPLSITESPVQPPKVIQDVLDIAYGEWETLAGKTLDRVNKYTEWRGKGVGFGWCAGYVTWCMMEAGVPMYEKEHFLDDSHDTPEGFFPVEGVMHAQEAGVGTLLVSYQRMNRTSKIPQPGFILVYGCSYNKTIHVGLVYEVQELGEGRYRITTLEGNMSNRVKMYVRDYDMNVTVNTNSRKSTNLTEVPKDERIRPASTYVDYSVTSAKPSSSASSKYPYYVNCFLMPWVPEDPALATPVPTAVPTPAPTVTPAPTAAPTPAPTATPIPTNEVTSIVIETSIPTSTPVSGEIAAPVTTPEPTEAPDTYPCHGRNGTCPYITYDANDPFCRACDRNENGVEDNAE